MRLLLEENNGCAFYESQKAPVVLETPFYKYKTEYLSTIERQYDKVLKECSSVLRVSLLGMGNEETILVEGVDWIVVTSGDKIVAQIKKIDVFRDCVDYLSGMVSESGVVNGYRDNNSDELKRLIYLAITSYLAIKNEKIFIPYISGFDYSRSPVGDDYSRIPRSYSLTEEDARVMKEKLAHFFDDYRINSWLTFSVFMPTRTL